MKVQGKSDGTRIQHAMRQLRGAYMENVRAGRCKLDRKVLKEFDNCMRIANERFAKAVPAKR